MKRTALLSALALFAAGVEAQQSNAVDHAQPRPPSTVKAQVTTITEHSVTTFARDGSSSTTQDVQTSEPVLMTNESSAVSVLPEPQISDQLDLTATVQRLHQYHQSLRSAKNILTHGADADALARYASQAEALAGQAGRADDVMRYRKVRATASDIQFALDRRDSVKARALLNTLGAQLQGG